MAGNLTFQNPSISHAEAVRLLAGDLEESVIYALVSIGLNEVDRIWAQNTCSGYLNNDNEAVVTSAVTALGHIARRFGEIDKDAIFSALNAAKHKHPSLEGIIDDTLDDIDMFT